MIRIAKEIVNHGVLDTIGIRYHRNRISCTLNRNKIRRRFSNSMQAIAYTVVKYYFQDILVCLKNAPPGFYHICSEFIQTGLSALKRNTTCAKAKTL